MYKQLLALLFAAVTVQATPIDDFSVRFVRRQSSNNYPPALQTPPQSSLPQAWIDALNAATSAGKIPNTPPSIVNADGSIAYPQGAGSNEDICNWTLTKCTGQRDVDTAPDSEWTVSFDDGPTAASDKLYDYLHSHSQAGTHFMIGSQILVYQDQFKHAMQTGQQAAVHTWSHSLMSSKTNMELLGELGWNMQIIYDLSGRIPTLWRPPQGDVDNRVRAVAENVFNLTTVMWNAECNDWCINAQGQSSCPGQTPGGSPDSVRQAIQTALHGPKSPGVTILEHELNQNTVGFFQEYYPSLAGMGWKPQAVSDHYGWSWYANAANNDDIPVNVTSIDTTTVAAALAKNTSQAEPSLSSTTALPSSTSTQSQSTSIASASHTPTKQSITTIATGGATSLSIPATLTLSLLSLVYLILVI